MSDLNVYTTAEINALTPITGDLVIDSDLNAVKLYDGAAWKTFTTDATSIPYQNRWGASFDGTSSFLSSTLSSPTDVYTFSVWVKPNVDITSSSPTNKQTLLGNGSRRLLGLGAVTSYTANEIITINYTDGTTVGAFSLANGTISSSTWNHIAVSWQSSSETNSGSPGYDVWLNGVKATGTNAVSGGTSGPPTSPMNLSDLYIGQRGRTTADEFYGGLVDEIAIFNAALSAADITAIYNGTAPNGKPNDLTEASSYDTDRTANLIGYWRMGDDSNDSPVAAGSITGITDSSGNGNDATQGTASNQPSFSDLTGETIYS